jgi:hypothetical protein
MARVLDAKGVTQDVASIPQKSGCGGRSRSRDPATSISSFTISMLAFSRLALF